MIILAPPSAIIARFIALSANCKTQLINTSRILYFILLRNTIAVDVMFCIFENKILHRDTIQNASILFLRK